MIFFCNYMQKQVIGNNIIFVNVHYFSTNSHFNMYTLEGRPARYTVEYYIWAISLREIWIVVCHFVRTNPSKPNLYWHRKVYEPNRQKW